MADELELYKRDRSTKIPIGAANIIVSNRKDALFGLAGTDTTDWILISDGLPWIVGSVISNTDGTLLIEFSPDAETVTYPVSIAVTGGAAIEDSGVAIEKSGDAWVRFTYTTIAAQTSFTLNLYGRGAA
jgi:hypothetical protein